VASPFLGTEWLVLAYTQLATHRHIDTSTHRIVDITNSGPMKTFSWKRLKQLDFSFHFHRLLNEAQEIESTQMDDPKDFSNGTL
jgi:hypothetical protein